jgi:hypothetical protein
MYLEEDIRIDRYTVITQHPLSVWGELKVSHRLFEVEMV